MTCECCPYGSQCLLVSAQVIMGITLVVSIIGWWMTWLLGIFAWVFLMLLACTTVHRCVVVVSGILACLAALSQFIMAGLSQELNVFCHNSSDDGQQFVTKACHNFTTVLTVFGIVTGIGWILSAMLTFALLLQLKQKDDRTLSAWGDDNNDDTPWQAPPKAATTHNNNNVTTTNRKKPGTITNEISQLPDGSTKIKTITINADGSQIVTERIESPTGTTTSTVIMQEPKVTASSAAAMPAVVTGYDEEYGKNGHY